MQREIITGNKKFSEIISSLDKVAESRSIVLIQGASGTGKELLAERIHSKSRRANGPFVSVNCAGLTDVELEIELFGIERNNGQGQVTTKVGKFEQAHAGTLLIEEIGQMDLKIQSKLLRTLQEGKIDRVGGRGTLSVDVRVLVGSSQDLRDFVKSGKFREDLFFRLNVIKVEIPRLVDREEDIPMLANHFIAKISESLGMTNAEEFPKLTEEGLTKLQSYEWPGNVRELENVIERAVVTGNRKEIFAKDIFLEHISYMKPKDYFSGGMTLHEIEKEVILKNLKFYKGNRTHTAKALGISIRTLRNKLNEYRAEGVPEHLLFEELENKYTLKILQDKQARAAMLSGELNVVAAEVALNG